MFVFLIPLRNRATVKDWSHCWAICEETVRSAASQLSTDLPVRVVLVCKDHGHAFSHPQLDMVIVDTPDPPNNWQARSEDKYAKIHAGLVHIRKHYAPCYVMRLDADDLVSNRIAGHVLADDNKLGYLVEEGYRWKNESAYVTRHQQFHLHSGSTSILYADAGSLPASMDANPGDYDLLRLGHHIVATTFEERGTPLAALPFPAVIYRTATGQNLSSEAPEEDGPKPNWRFYAGLPLHYLRQLLRHRLLTKQLRREFGLAS